MYVSQLIRNAKVCSVYDQYLNRGRLLTNKLLLQGFHQSRLKVAFRKFCDRCGFSKTLKSLQKTSSHESYSKIDCIKTYDFSTLYTTIPHDKLKSRLFQIIDNCFLNKNGTRKYKFLVIGKQDTYFVRNHSDCPHKYSEVDIKSMLEFLIDKIYVVFGNHVFQQYVGIPIGTNCAPLLADLFFIFIRSRICSETVTG